MKPQPPPLYETPTKEVFLLSRSVLNPSKAPTDAMGLEPSIRAKSLTAPGVLKFAVAVLVLFPAAEVTRKRGSHCSMAEVMAAK